MPPPARNTHHPQTSSRIRTTLSNRYRQNVTTKHGRQEHKQSITKSNHRDIAGISKSESQQPYNKGGLLTTTRWTHNSARTASPGVRALYSFFHTARTPIWVLWYLWVLLTCSAPSPIPRTQNRLIRSLDRSTRQKLFCDQNIHSRPRLEQTESTKPIKRTDFILTCEMPTQSLLLFHLIK